MTYISNAYHVMFGPHILLLKKRKKNHNVKINYNLINFDFNCTINYFNL